MLYRRIVVKIGTNVLTTKNGTLNIERIEHVAKQLSILKEKGIDIILVSSGAMGAGRMVLHKDLNGSVATRQILAAVGQVRLVNAYQKALEKHGLLCAQVLTTKDDFRSRQHYLNMQRCFQALLSDNVIPIVNENDVISVDEIMFTDNDELAGLIATMMDVEGLLVLTNVDGVYTGDPDNSTSTIVEHIDPERDNWERYIAAVKSSFGRGGMHTKCAVAARLAAMGIVVHIVNGNEEKIIVDALEGKTVGTRFTSPKKACPIKRWIGSSDGQERGSVVIDHGAAAMLRSQKVVSLLPVGITSINGTFEKGDIVKIKTQDGTNLGLGMAAYDSKTANTYIGKKGEKPLIHYDYLYLF